MQQNQQSTSHPSSSTTTTSVPFSTLHPPPFGFPPPPHPFPGFSLPPPPLNFSHHHQHHPPPPLPPGGGGSGQQSMPPQPNISPPYDAEQKSIIDKLAQFVARNGHEFEAATRNKQHDNPRFRFLFSGGEYHAYYQHRLSLERDLMRFQPLQIPSTTQIASPPSQFSFPPPPPPNPMDPASLAQLNALQIELNTLKDQIAQSEKNLLGQNEFLRGQKKLKIEESLKAVVSEKLTRLRAESSIDFNELERLSNKIVQVCTKDAISAGRNFVFHNNLSEKHVETICYYLTQKIIDNESSNNARLHLIYFMNDLVHYANKKRIDMAKRQLERVIIPCFCYAMDKTDEEKKSKMNKLLDIWEKDNYFSAEIMQKLRNPSVGVQYYQECVYAENSQLIESIETELDGQLKLMEHQHKEYVSHCSAQLAHVQNQIAQIKQKQHFMHVPPPIHLPPPPATGLLNQIPPQSSSSSSPSKPPQPLMSLMSINLKESGGSKHQSSSSTMFNKPPPSTPPQQLLTASPQTPPTSQGLSGKMPLMSIPPPSLTNSPSHSTSSSAGGLLPTPNIEPNNNMMKHPPTPSTLSNNSSGVSLQQSKQQHQQQTHLEIEMAYYSLPAGLITQLVKIEDEPYKPIDPKLVKLPAPQAPSQRLLKAMDEFYSSTNNKSRNLEGWSKTGLYEFYKAKLKYLASSQSKSDDRPQRQRRRDGKRSMSKSSSSSSSGRSSSSDSSRSRSRERRRKRGEKRRKRRHSSSSSSSSRSRSTSRSSSSTRRSSSSRSSSRSRRERRRDDRPRPISRSPTPPNQHVGFSTATAAASSVDTRLDMSNKGHQMLQRMGWSGQTGLGRAEQGMVNPIDASGDVRDKTEMYRGVGVKSDPFEAFRKNKSKGYIQRIRSRDEQRDSKKFK